MPAKKIFSQLTASASIKIRPFELAELAADTLPLIAPDEPPGEEQEQLAVKAAWRLFVLGRNEYNKPIPRSAPPTHDPAASNMPLFLARLAARLLPAFTNEATMSETHQEQAIKAAGRIYELSQKACDEAQRKLLKPSRLLAGKFAIKTELHGQLIKSGGMSDERIREYVKRFNDLARDNASGTAFWEIPALKAMEIIRLLEEIRIQPHVLLKYYKLHVITHLSHWSGAWEIEFPEAWKLVKKAIRGCRKIFHDDPEALKKAVINVWEFEALALHFVGSFKANRKLYTAELKRINAIKTTPAREKGKQLKKDREAKAKARELRKEAKRYGELRFRSH